MKSISIEPINNENIDEILELSLQDSTNIEELYENFKMRVMEQYGDCDFQFGQVVIYQKKNPHRRLSQNMKMTQMSTGKIELVILFPRENTPIIVLQLGDKEYFISEYTKFDKLSQILNKIKGQVSTVIQQQKFDKITINGIDINYSQEKSESFRKFMQGHINQTISIVIHAQKGVEIPKKQQNLIEKEPSSVKKEDKKNQPNNDLKEPQAFEVQGTPQQKVEVKPENRQNKRNQSKYQIPIKQQKAQQAVSKPNNKVQLPKVQITVQQKNKVEQVITFPKKLQNPLQLIINFETQSGKTQKSIQANRAHSLLQILPSIVSALKQAGFQWQNNEYDHNRDRDKLRIIIDGNNQFKKMDRPFRQLVSQTQGQLILTFERHYEGGKGGNE